MANVTVSEAMIRKAGNGLALSKIKSLNLSDKDLTHLDPTVMNKLVTLTTLDLSNNNICSIPDNLLLPSLTTLDISDNELSSVSFGKNFPQLTSLYIAGNHDLGKSDRLVAMVENSNLTHIDDQRSSSLSQVVRQIRSKFEIQVKAKWEVLFAEPYATGIPEEEVDKVTEEFIVTLRGDGLLKNADSKFEKYMLEKLAKEMVESAKNMSIYKSTHSLPGTPRSARLNDLHSPETTPVRQSSRTPVPNRRLMDTPPLKPPTPRSGVPNADCSKTPDKTPKAEGKGKKRRRDSSPGSVSKPRAKSFRTETGQLSSPKFSPKSPASNKKTQDRGRKRRRSLTPESECKHKTKSYKTQTGHLSSPKYTSLKELHIDQLPPVPDYDPTYFVRCHSDEDGPSDDNTKVWRCAFEPKPNCPGEHTNLVATVGGKIVCLVDCQTGKVMRRFKDTDKKESFYTLAWTTISVDKDNSSETTNILAVAGDACDVKLIHPSQLVMYATLEGHRRYISCLVFHPTYSTILFSGGKDNRIIMWDIGIPNLSDYSTNFRKLKCLVTPGTDPLNLALSMSTNSLLAGCESTCYLWKLQDMQKVSKEPDLELCLPITDDNSDTSSDDSKTGDIVDGLVLLSDNFVVTKCVGNSCLTVFDLKSCIPMKKPSRQTRSIKVTPTALLNYTRTTVDYIYLAASQGLVAAGDDKGSIHLYNLNQFLGEKPISCDTTLQQSKVLDWPEVTLGRHTDSMKDLLTEQAVVINSIAMNHSKDYMVCGTDNNLVCIWKRSTVKT
ncbi:leucine-rich repeat and WD repeat-containing protein 1-like [Ylistrum balloti]|uniref:leucine-rich repeat and WD repeat-containing protein 1-like n=1 Tax=Ylistrum balloti TaxID=509963 RepID=UPI002905DD4B|nr:leucine-rich repeat and WD repeat-containing protein 1-like [Ylistrum balloti]